MSDTKMVLIVRKDLNMRKGKIAAQCSHATLAVFFNKMQDKSRVYTLDLQRSYREYSDDVYEWMTSSFKKVCVYVNNEAELLDVYQKAIDAGLPCSLITDAGHTEFHGVPTKTVVAIGPAGNKWIDPITGGLPLL